jgi:SAM domain (Sterile alpha motif)
MTQLFSKTAGDRAEGLNLDIDSWLRGIGLAQYAEMFRANDIDIELLGRLTNDDLKDIGVVSFGHRKKLLEAIAELGSASARPPAVPEPTPTPATVAPPPIEAAAERRHVTVMFCDLVDSTGITARLAAGRAHNPTHAYQRVRRRGNQGGCGAGSSAARTG